MLIYVPFNIYIIIYSSFFLSPKHGPVPATYTTNLKAVLNAVFSHIYQAQPTITTNYTPGGYFQTSIWGPNYAHSYNAPKSMNLYEAEANAIYDLLKHTTNVLGYTIVDDNYETLNQMVCEINRYNAEINELQTCAEDAQQLTHSISHAIVQSHHQLISHVNIEGLLDLNASMEQLIKPLGQHCGDIVSAYTKFKETKVSTT